MVFAGTSKIQAERALPGRALESVVVYESRELGRSSCEPKKEAMMLRVLNIDLVRIDKEKSIAYRQLGNYI